MQYASTSCLRTESGVFRKHIYCKLSKRDPNNLSKMAISGDSQAHTKKEGGGGGGKKCEGID